MITGANGTGKTTLFNALAATLPAQVPSVMIGQDVAQANAVLEQFAQLTGAERQEAMAYFAAQNGNMRTLSEGAGLSAGEVRKLVLALGLVRRPQVLLFDEATNHLDLSSKQALAQMLREYPGAFVLVTHDELLIDRLRGI
ncbi:ATP-binding cassette domain-containing protein [Bifidobacterium gallicum]|uniref:ABC transporter, ATP-binding protein n=1 Tax=Bifidobacterium gallicum DSM 20093 = LMG 11596 TaxID=561180 RepID=D1NU08_9BIFI|nr:ATP-binding cassette domain-containing protein [Bifidobacterium gallicum]EFA23212.1 ABC transporter, ATP-binding protein [Bifidobacterium gallicum DSM 20093 = LMG 11596]KFI58874.1 ABC transporter, ATP-binding protein [Bifidobacterium gallicum DSM 20093 = LMG 11596]